MMDRYAQDSKPATCIGIDFGTGSLVCGCALQDGDYKTLSFPGWSQEIPDLNGSGPVHRIPVLVHYPDSGDHAIGDEVLRAGCRDHPATARWIRNYLLKESTAQISTGTGRRITFRDAAADLLGTVFARAVQECPDTGYVVFAIPDDAPSWYAVWLSSIAHTAGIESCHTIDECAAVPAGYGLTVEEGQSCILVSIDENDLAISLVRNNGSRGLGVAGTSREDTGCRALDGWIAQEIVAKSRVRYTGTRAQKLYDAALASVGDVYYQLARGDEVSIDFTDPVTSLIISVRLTTDDITHCIAECGLPFILDQALGHARAVARTQGYPNDPPIAVLMTGRGSVIPAVQALVQQQFPGIPVRCDHPFDAIARGAATSSPRTPRADRIKNHYALQYWDPTEREHRYRFLVRSGARYPSAGQVARITISAAYDGQTRLGIPLYELRTAPEATAPDLELVSDPAGGIRLAGPPEDTNGGSRPVLMNGRTPTLLTADPPALKGEPRFELTFVLDRERRLCVTARDLMTGLLVKREAPVHQLT
ncbi:hypothetical protein [Methanoregula sp.]|uniref:hypothetical protein n=1 Tax=Methanoregula sp. TaxID=2052170 RepID=UPI00236AB733|nr:hypothetical protein [Methanoregula sp.]MDD1686628.1 hypothetical protein [Methanoregula sp.]